MLVFHCLLASFLRNIYAIDYITVEAEAEVISFEQMANASRPRLWPWYDRYWLDHTLIGGLGTFIQQNKCYCAKTDDTQPQEVAHHALIHNCLLSGSSAFGTIATFEAQTESHLAILRNFQNQEDL